jgi:hypothetical protein
MRSVSSSSISRSACFAVGFGEQSLVVRDADGLDRHSDVPKGSQKNNMRARRADL